jgi:hypothetical protein
VEDWRVDPPGGGEAAGPALPLERGGLKPPGGGEPGGGEPGGGEPGDPGLTVAWVVL